MQTNSEAVAEIGPLKYVAKITGQEIDRVVNWFILLFIIVFDPLAVILLVSAQHAFKKNKPKKNIYGESKNYFELRNQNINKIIKQRNIVDNIKQQLIKEVREEIQKDKIQQKQEIIETLESEKELDPEPIEEVKQTPRPPDTPPKSM